MGSRRPPSALNVYVAETKAKLRQRADLGNVTGLQLQDLALISWKSPGIDAQRKAMLIAEQAAALEAWMARAAGSSTTEEPRNEGALSAPAGGTSRALSMVQSMVEPALSTVAPSSLLAESSRPNKLLREYIEACGGRGSQLDGWKCCRVSRRGTASYVEYISPRNEKFSSRAAVARAFGLTPQKDDRRWRMHGAQRAPPAGHLHTAPSARFQAAPAAHRPTKAGKRAREHPERPSQRASAPRDGQKGAACVFIPGARIEARHGAAVHGSSAVDWFPGYIEQVHADGACSVVYDDGDFEEHVLTKYIRLPDSGVYSAERIISHRWVRGKIEYRVRWCVASSRPQHRQLR